MPVITVSEAMATIAVYRNDHKHTTPVGGLADRPLEPGAVHPAALPLPLRRRALATLTRLEMEDAVSVRDVVAVLQPGEMVRRIAEEIESHLVELGSDGRLIHLQTEELSAGVDESLTLVLRDYTDEHGHRPPALPFAPTPLWTCPRWWPPSNLPALDDQMHAELAPRGYRLLHRLPQHSPRR